MRVSYSPDSSFPHGPQPESAVDAAQVAALPRIDAYSPQEHRPQVPGAVVECSRRCGHLLGASLLRACYGCEKLELSCDTAKHQPV